MKGKMEGRTGWREQNESQTGGEEKWHTCWCCRDQQRACRMAQASAEKLVHTSLPKRKEWPQCHRERSWQVRRSRPYQKEKEQSRLSTVPDHGGRESRWARAAPWRERGGSVREHGEERVDSTVNEGRFQGGKGGQARRASLEQVEESMNG